jgi:hypothetical protein
MRLPRRAFSPPPRALCFMPHPRTSWRGRGQGEGAARARAWRRGLDFRPGGELHMMILRRVNHVGVPATR